VDPRLRIAVDASLAWYDALCALHGVPCLVDEGIWLALTPPPPLHSAVKVVELGVPVDRVVAAARDGGGVADSFGELDLVDRGFDLLFTARWIHRSVADEPTARGAPSWSIVRSADALAAWTAKHDTAAVLLPGLLARSSFQVLARYADGVPNAGAVLHLGTGAVSISNVWSDGGDDPWPELVSNAAAKWPRRDLVGYERGADLDAALRAGFADVGPQHVWVAGGPGGGS